jgi:hypothetical protein
MWVQIPSSPPINKEEYTLECGAVLKAVKSYDLRVQVPLLPQITFCMNPNGEGQYCEYWFSEFDPRHTSKIIW